ncbi:MAG: hypothetical protein N3A61_07420, partial [Ignavibacteria bacterium]|nr:hypothetical protein [Ignavibacteria bacterium]
NCNFLKLVIQDDIVYDFSSESDDVIIEEHSNFTDIYFKNYKSLKEEISKYETIKLICVEKEMDLFDLNNHIKLVLHLQDEHFILIELLDPNQIFIE